MPSVKPDQKFVDAALKDLSPVFDDMYANLFMMDGTLIGAWANLKSFQPTDGLENPGDGDPGSSSMDFLGEKWGQPCDLAWHASSKLHS